ncbi:hypothetical protein V8E52_004329 [Russula decolorans]
MLVGLFRLPFVSDDAFDIKRVLQNQGLIWLLLAIVCEIPPTVFICLNLNDPMNWIFETPNGVTMTIAATRMYRSLMDLGSSEISQDSLQPESSWHTLSKMRVRPGPIPLSQMESVRTEIDQSSKSQMAGSSSDIDTASHGG